MLRTTPQKQHSRVHSDRMKCVLFVALFATFAFADIWKNCGGPQDHLQISNVEISPDPPQIGENLTVTATGNLDETVTGGIIEVSLQYSGITILNTNLSLCSAIVPFLQCPIAQGPVSISITQYIPSEVIPGSYTGQVNIYDQNESPVACISLSFNLGGGKHKMNPGMIRAPRRRIAQLN